MPSGSVLTSSRGPDLTHRSLKARTQLQQVRLSSHRVYASAIAEPPAQQAGTSVQLQEARDSDASNSAEAQEAGAAPAPQYNWHKQWYPVAIAANMDPGQPHALQLLNMHIVLWRDSQQLWRCFEDRCPHRLAPLSEGRIEPSDGSLFCNYHGWRFRGDGSCAGIPQLPPSQSAATDSPRACAVSYPTREAEGLLWVWPSSGKGAQAEADEAGYPGMCPQYDTGDAKPLMGGWYFRDAPTHWLSVKENGWTDPSHDSILHDGAGLSRDAAAPLYVQSSSMDAQGFSVTYATKPPAEGDASSRATNPANPSGTLTDVTQMPVGSMRSFSSPGGQPLLMWGYFVPQASNLTRHITAFALPPDAAPLQPLLKRLNRLPVWANHIYINMVMDADIAVQAGVDRNRRLGRGDVFAPADSDKGVLTLQHWLHKFAAGSLPVPEGQQPSMSRRQLLDRFHQHTEKCPSCFGAFKIASLVLKLAAAAFGALLMAAAASLAVRGVTRHSITCGLGSVACGLAVAASSWLIKQFTFVDFSHEEKHTSKAS